MLERLRNVYSDMVRNREEGLESLITLLGDITDIRNHILEILNQEQGATDKELLFLVADLGKMYKNDYVKDKRVEGFKND